MCTSEEIVLNWRLRIRIYRKVRILVRDWIVKADILNSLRYLLITEQLLGSVKSDDISWACSENSENRKIRTD